VAQTGQEELRVVPDEQALAAVGLTADQVLPALNVVRREGLELRTGFTLRDDREIPLAVRRADPMRRPREDLLGLRLATPAGTLPLGALADVRRMPPPPPIVHHDGRREIKVAYTFGREAPSTGAARNELDAQIRAAVQQVHRPAGYTIETAEEDSTFSWFKKILVPVVLLLLAVLAVTFESLTLPLLVLLALPLTMLGTTWALWFADMPALEPMALMGILALIGLTVNPAILLVDRMQERVRSGSWTAGAAALAAVRERTRPVLMTTATTVAGLWPLALVTGRENEIWPPFATVVMGGLVTSTLLTLLVIPVGFVFLHRLDAIFGRLGPWIVIAWGGLTAGIMAALAAGGAIDSLRWRIVTTLLVAAALLAVAVLIFRRPQRPEPASSAEGPPEVEVRFLKKVYGRPGPIGKAWRAPERFARAVLRRGGRAFDPASARGRILPLALVAAGALYLGTALQGPLWRMLYLLVAAALVARMLREARRARGRADARGRVDPGGPEGALALMAPWAALCFATFDSWLLPWAADEPTELWLGVPILAALLLVWGQLGRASALRMVRGELAPRAAHGRLRWARNLWRRSSRRLFGLDLPREEVRAVSGAAFRASHGMVGVLGPNGAGKTTLLRMLAGILDPSVGTITLGGVSLPRLRRYLARYMGYLPQEFGLPADLTAREYLDYYALLYEIRPAGERRARVQRLITEVGLEQRADEKIGSYSGGMRQRVAVARTLLRLPPIIIVDEPTVGLDPRERIRFRNLLSQLAEGRVVLFSTHVVEDVAVACPRVIVMSGGRIVFDGPPERLAVEAQGRVWEIDLVAGDTELPAGAMLVDQVPREGGRVHTRVLAAERPRAEAVPASPTLEDGYLWLVGAGGPA
jgi:ABC-type multidrug transport system ATPase subunit